MVIPFSIISCGLASRFNIDHWHNIHSTGQIANTPQFHLRTHQYHCKKQYWRTRMPWLWPTSPIGYVSEFWKPSIVGQIFHMHPLWKCLRQLLINGSIWPLSDLRHQRQRTQRGPRWGAAIRQQQRGILQTRLTSQVDQNGRCPRLLPPHDPDEQHHKNPWRNPFPYEHYGTTNNKRARSIHCKRST